MRIEKIKSRSVLFTYSTSAGWDLNLHLIMGQKYNYIIDTGLGELSVEPIKEYIKGENKPIVVINTHYHWDHVWGNNSFNHSTIISHILCRDLIQSKWEAMMERNKEYCQGEVKMYLPNLVFEKELYFPEDKIRIIYTPGHTIDSITVVDEEDKVINAGDNIGDTMDEIVPHLYCENSLLYMDTLLKYKEIDFDTCISGHNMVLGKEVIDKILSLV